MAKLRIPLAWVLFLSTYLWVWTDAPVRALWPSVVALGIVVLTRQVLVGLSAGGAAGALLLCGGDPFTALVSFFGDHLLPAFGSSWKVGAIFFTFMLGGFAALIERGGGLTSLVQKGLRKDPARRLQWSAYGLGLVCFFDGLANSMLVGRLFRRLGDEHGVSRARLAYICDSTSSAVACVAVVSTWIAYQLAMIREGYALAGRESEVQPYAVFFASIPANYYCWFTLALLALAIYRNLQLGPMRAWEASAREAAKEVDAPAESVESAGAWRALLPLVVLIGAMLGGLYVSGAETPWPFTFRKAAEAFGNAEGGLVLVVSSAVASLVAFALYPRRAGKANAAKVYEEGVMALFGPILILLGAWVLSSTLADLNATEVLSRLLGDRLPPALLPVSVFVVGALISFTTGTSWGTMGILMPLAIPVTFSLAPDAQVLLPGIVAAVFSGAVFGDHCSPLSDTTIVSSIACDINPADHVKTQLPYALTAASCAALLGFIPFGLGLPSWGGLVLGLAGLCLVAFWASRARRG